MCIFKQKQYFILERERERRNLIPCNTFEILERINYLKFTLL
jgi:hypothetical protein